MVRPLTSSLEGSYEFLRGTTHHARARSWTASVSHFRRRAKRLLDFCARRKITATFFLVADRARQLPALSRSFTAAGHSVGNHSLDHAYGHFFRSSTHLRGWIDDAQAQLTELTGQTPIAFRSPAGLRTPELRRALLANGLSLVHWRHRFFDAVFPWTEAAAIKAADRSIEGDIILLHDIPRRNPDRFLRSLDFLIQRLRERGLEPSALRSEDVSNGVLE